MEIRVPFSCRVELAAAVVAEALDAVDVDAENADYDWCY